MIFVVPLIQCPPESIKSPWNALGHLFERTLYYEQSVSSYFYTRARLLSLVQFWLLFSFFPQHNSITNLKKRRWCAWDSNPGLQDGRCKQNHGAMAAALKPSPILQGSAKNPTPSPKCKLFVKPLEKRTTNTVMKSGQPEFGEGFLFLAENPLADVLTIQVRMRSFHWSISLPITDPK